MRKLLLFFILLFLVCLDNAVSQTTEKSALFPYLPLYTFEFEQIKKDSIHLIEEAEEEPIFLQPTAHVNKEVKKMLDQLKLYNEKLTPYVQGFRVQLYSGNEMSTAVEVESHLKSVLKEIESEHLVYRTYQAPTWKVRVGDFIERLDAHRLHHLLKKDFPTALILPDSEVNIRKIK